MAEPARPLDDSAETIPANDQGGVVVSTSTQISQTSTSQTTVNSSSPGVQSGLTTAPVAANDNNQPVSATNNSSGTSSPSVGGDTLANNTATTSPGVASPQRTVGEQPANKPVEGATAAKDGETKPDVTPGKADEKKQPENSEQKDDAAKAGTPEDTAAAGEKTAEAKPADPNNAPPEGAGAQNVAIDPNSVSKNESAQASAAQVNNPAPPAGIRPGAGIDTPQRLPPQSNVAANTGPQPSQRLPVQNTNNSNDPAATSNRPGQTSAPLANSRRPADRLPNTKNQDTEGGSGKKPVIGGQKEGEPSEGSKLPTPSSNQKSASSDSKEAPSSSDKADTKGKGGLEQRAVKAVAGKAVDAAGKAFGWNATQKAFVMHLIGLLLELISGIGTVIFIFHVIGLLFWLVRKQRYEQVKPMLLPFAGLILGGLIIILLEVALVFTVVACEVQQSRIPFGIPIGVASSIASYFNADVGNLAQLCSRLNLHGAGVGSLAGTRPGGGGGGGATTTIGDGTSGVSLVDALGAPAEVPLIAGTLFTRPQSLAPELGSQINAAGYVSPAQCKLGDLPFTNASSLTKVRLADGRDTIITLPMHQTVECIQNDSAKNMVKSMHIGKIIRLVYADGQLGDYVTIEYPNGLRISYYHLTLLPDLTLGKTLNAGEVIGNLGQTGQTTFQGMTIRFEYKMTNGQWQAFNPINTNADISLLTPFPCAESANSRCLLL